MRRMSESQDIGTAEIPPDRVDDQAGTEARPEREPLSRDRIKCILEGALLASGETLAVDRLAMLFDEWDRPEPEVLRALLSDLALDYEGRGIELREVASGFRFQVRKEFGPWVSRLWTEKAPRYSRALLETLALIAYRQPITRGEIEEVRGVTVSSEMIKSLLEREWIRVVGHRDVPGRPALYATTHDFLDYFDLKSLDELPTLSEIRDLDRLNEELDLQMAPAAAILAVEAAAGKVVNESVDQDAGQPQHPLTEQGDDLDLSADMQQVDEVLRRVEDSFRRKDAGEDSDKPVSEPEPTPGTGA